MKPFKFFCGYTNTTDLRIPAFNFNTMRNEERRVFHINVANIPRDRVDEYIRAITQRFGNPIIPIVDYPTILR
jgi:hypothetical protein